MRCLSHSPGRARGARPAAAGAAQAQSGYDRRGGDYMSFKIRNGDPAVCAARCERDARCRAWSFSYPRTDRMRSPPAG